MGFIRQYFLEDSERLSQVRLRSSGWLRSDGQGWRCTSAIWRGHFRLALRFHTLLSCLGYRLPAKKFNFGGGWRAHLRLLVVTAATLARHHPAET